MIDMAAAANVEMGLVPHKVLCRQAAAGKNHRTSGALSPQQGLQARRERALGSPRAPGNRR